MTSIKWLIDQIKEYDFTPISNNEEYVIVIPKWIFDSKQNESKEMHKQEIINAINDISENNVKYANNIISSFTKIEGELFMHNRKLAEQYYKDTFKK